MAIEKVGPGRWKELSQGRKWLLIVAVATVAVVVGLSITAIFIGRHFQPFIRAKAIEYLEQRFDSEVELTALRVHIPWLAMLRLARSGPAELITVEGERLLMRHLGRRDIPPMFALRNFTASVNLRTLFEKPTVVPVVTLDGMEINIPPKGQRPNIAASQPGSMHARFQPSTPNQGVVISRVIIHDAKLAILPKDPSKNPLRFDLKDVHLDSAGKEVAMKYEALLTNPRPRGDIQSRGSFGPWASGEPSETPLSGTYLFEHADLSIFKGIAGVLRSTGQFEGRLGTITARGEASVPDFRLKQSGNPVPLTTSFEVLVDGTNGNTALKPVTASLGLTNFTTSGTIIKHEGEERKAILLDVHMPNGQMRDVLTLAMKGKPFMEGVLRLRTKIGIPPLTGKVREKLVLDGNFEVTKGKFLRSKIQDQIDSLSRRGQGSPNNQEIDEVVSRMTGVFNLADEVITFKTLAFTVAGAAVNLDGNYDIGGEALDFHGALMLNAKVSQTQTGWKRWVLKPVDPVFAKNGAGTFLKIKITGTAKEPRFAHDR